MDIRLSPDLEEDLCDELRLLTTSDDGLGRLKSPMDMRLVTMEKPLLIDELTSRTVRWDLPGGEGPPPSPLGSIRYGTSTLLSSEGSSIPSESPLRLPPWLEGTWAATYRFDRVTFPQGKGRDVLTLRVPGAGLGTCLALPNVGYSPRNPFPLRFLASGGGATDAYSYDDIAYNAPRILEAFWTAAKVASVRTDGGHSRRLSPPCSVTGEGCSSEKSPYLHLPANRIVLEYDGPTRSGGRRAQTMDVTAMRSRTTTRGEGGVGGGEDSDAVLPVGSTSSIMCSRICRPTTKRSGAGQGRGRVRIPGSRWREG